MMYCWRMCWRVCLLGLVVGVVLGEDTEKTESLTTVNVHLQPFDHFADDVALDKRLSNIGYQTTKVTEEMERIQKRVGAIGPRGPRGDKGPPGIPGNMGREGDRGPRGPAGEDGRPGPQGAPGPQGPPGPAGATGPRGKTGRPGVKGRQGPNGRPGQAGMPGLRGKRGVRGEMGPTGKEGYRGYKGISGPRGPRGRQGPPAVFFHGGRFHVNFGGSVWTLVRRVQKGTSWHPATDHCRGYEVYGKYDSPSSQSTFSVRFNDLKFNRFMFATGDFERWLITERAEVLKTPGRFESRILSSSASSSPSTAVWYNRENNKEDPWISIKDHSAEHFHTIVYGENRFDARDKQSYNVLHHNGANVWVAEAGTALANLAFISVLNQEQWMVGPKDPDHFVFNTHAAKDTSFLVRGDGSIFRKARHGFAPPAFTHKAESSSVVKMGNWFFGRVDAHHFAVNTVGAKHPQLVIRDDGEIWAGKKNGVAPPGWRHSESHDLVMRIGDWFVGPKNEKHFVISKKGSQICQFLVRDDGALFAGSENGLAPDSFRL